MERAPDSVEEIGENAFDGCSSMTILTRRRPWNLRRLSRSHPPRRYDSGKGRLAQSCTARRGPALRPYENMCGASSFCFCTPLAARSTACSVSNLYRWGVLIHDLTLLNALVIPNPNIGSSCPCDTDGSPRPRSAGDVLHEVCSCVGKRAIESGYRCQQVGWREETKQRESRRGRCQCLPDICHSTADKKDHGFTCPAFFQESSLNKHVLLKSIRVAFQ